MERLRSFLIIALGSLGCWVGCSEPTRTGGNCAEFLDCRTDWNYGGGTECVNGRCVCRNPAHSEEPCCPGGGINCEQKAFQCRPKAECEAAEPDAGGGVTSATGGGMGGAGGADGAGGAGGAGDPPDVTPPECTPATVDLDCEAKIPEGADKKCIDMMCLDGTCAIEITPHRLESQIAGDCQTRYCMFDATIASFEDPSDYYNDGRICTYDYCAGTKAVNDALEDGHSLVDGGYCKDKNVVECIDGDPNAYACGAGTVCDFIYCVPMSCMTNGVKDGAETGIDCGGPCYPCFHPQMCNTHDDCFHHICMAGKCAIPNASDGQKNNGETGVDCGGLEMAIPRCPTDGGCVFPEDCQSMVCWTGECQAPSCFDGRQNGEEVGVDCGPTCGNSC